MSRAPSVEDTANPSPRVAFRALLILMAITVVLAAATAVYLFTRPTPYSGNWVGSGNVQGVGGPIGIEVYLTLDQRPFGISGTGRICVFTNGTKGDTSTLATYIFPATVEESLLDSPTSFTIHSDEGTILPTELHVQSMLDGQHLTLTGTPQQGLLLTMERGSYTDFAVACDHLRF